MKSTEVSADHKVTFRIYAPKASEVSVSGDFGAGGKLTRDERGIWSITLGPLAPDFYSYTFQVDGVRTVDPRNALVKPGLASLDSMFLVPGAEADFETTRDVPHGEIRTAWYHSRTLDSLRSLRVYTPPGYEGGSEKYPGSVPASRRRRRRRGVVDDRPSRLHHRQSAGREEVRADDRGDAQRQPAAPGEHAAVHARHPAVTRSRAAMEGFQNRFTNELMSDVVPFAEAHYRVASGRENRAIAGLSMGGGQTLRVLTTHPDEFAHVAIWSAGLFGGNPADFEKRNSSFFEAADHVNKSVKVLSIIVGDKDFALQGSKSLAALLEKHGIKHELHISGGGHTWINWRHYLSELAPRLFR